MRDDLYKSLSTTPLYEQVAEQLETLIVEGQLKQGERLPAERELSERFGVSRTVIREAVKSLQEKGLVEIRPGVGTFVHNSTDTIMRQSLGRLVMIDQVQGLANLMQVREILEPEIAAIAAEQASADDLKTMQATIERMDASIHDMEAFIAADHQFHLTLARATKNILLVNLMDSVVDLLNEQRRKMFRAGADSPRRGQEHHIRILKAIQNRERDLARQMMIAHLRQIREDTEAIHDVD